MTETLPRPFLDAIHVQFDEDLQNSRAAIRQLDISEEEKDRLEIDIKKYAEGINPEELVHVPRDKILPYLINCIWRPQVRSMKSESEYTETVRSKAKDSSEDDSDAYETIEEEEEEDEEHEENKTRSNEQTFVEKKVGELENTGNNFKYKFLLDNVAPFYLEKKPTMMTEHKKSNTNQLDAAGRTRLRFLSRYKFENMQPEYRLPTLILKKHQFIKREEPRFLGPGTYDPHYYECRRNTKVRPSRGQMYNCTPRFGKEYVKTDCPDPGAYGNPYEHYWKMEDRLKHPCRTPLMQSGPCDVRGSTFRTVGSSLGPGHYNIKSTSIVDKRVSLRGPYDLFTPGRFDYLKPKNAVEPGQYGIFDTMKQNLFNRYNHLKGKLSKLNRDQKYTGERITVVSPMWPNESEENPGPGTYDIKDPIDYHRSCWGENYWAFNMSTRNPRGLGSDRDTDYDNAPTRYRPELADRNYCPFGCGWRSNFKSKTQRLDPREQAVLAERLRGKDEKYFKENECE